MDTIAALTSMPFPGKPDCCPYCGGDPAPHAASCPGCGAPHRSPIRRPSAYSAAMDEMRDNLNRAFVSALVEGENGRVRY